MENFKIEALCISETKGVQKHAVDEVNLKIDHGIENDAHAGNWHRQVSFLAIEAVEEMQQILKDRKEDIILKPGAFGENILTRGIDWTKVEVGGQVTIGDVKLEITQIGKECHTRCAIYYAAGDCIMPKMGVFGKVLEGGVINAGNQGNYCF